MVPHTHAYHTHTHIHTMYLVLDGHGLLGGRSLAAAAHKHADQHGESSNRESNTSACHRGSDTVFITDLEFVDRCTPHHLHTTYNHHTPHDKEAIGDYCCQQLSRCAKAQSQWRACVRLVFSSCQGAACQKMPHAWHLILILIK